MPDRPEIMQFFQYQHLPDHLSVISKPFSNHAERIVSTMLPSEERTVTLRKLLEAKDAAVRASMIK